MAQEIKNILIVDDRKAVLDGDVALFQSLLIGKAKIFGRTCVTEVAALVETTKIDILITDCDIWTSETGGKSPNNGIEVKDLVKQKNPDAVTILQTGMINLSMLEQVERIKRDDGENTLVPGSERTQRLAQLKEKIIEELSNASLYAEGYSQFDYYNSKGSDFDEFIQLVRNLALGQSRSR